MKTVVLFFAVLIISGKVRSQDWKQLSDSLIYYYQKKDYVNAIPAGIKAAAATKEKFGATHNVYASYLSLVASLYVTTQQELKAIPLLEESLAIYKTKFAEDHKDVIQTMTVLAVCYSATGQNHKAAPLLLQVSESTMRKSGSNSSDYAASLNKLGKVYEELGLYMEAEPLFLKALSIRQSTPAGKDEIATSLTNLGLLYKSMGQYDKAERLMLQGMQLRKEQTGEYSGTYANSLSNIASLYDVIGQYKKAEPFFILAATIYKDKSGPQSREYATILNNLGLLYQSTGEYDRSIRYLGDAMAIQEKLLGREHPLYLLSAASLAGTMQLNGDNAGAEKIYLQTIDNQKKTIGEKHPDYARSINDLAFLYKKTGRFAESVKLYSTSLQINREALGESHPDYAAALSNLGALYQATGEFKLAEPLLADAKKIERNNLLRLAGILTEKEKAEYLTGKNTLNHTTNSFIYNYPAASSDFYTENFNLQLLLKGFSLNDTRDINENIRASKDSGLVELYRDWQNNKQQLVKQYSLPVAGRRTDIEQLEQQTEIKEKELNQQSAAFKKANEELKPTFKRIQETLAGDEAAIEFVSFRLFRSEWTDSIMYGAYIVRKTDASPVFVTLCEEKQLGKFFTMAGKTVPAKMIYRSDVVDEENHSAISGDTLFALVWKPLLPYLGKIRKINFAPSGLLSRIAFHALPADSTKLLLDYYDLRQFTSISQLIKVSTRPGGQASIGLFGNCAFDADSATLASKQQPDSAKTTVYSPDPLNIKRGNWAQLPGTDKEVKSISTQFTKKKMPVRSFTGIGATEAAVKSLNGNAPAILHFATHGFFLPDPAIKKNAGIKAEGRNAFTLADDPMMRTGIVLAGANHAWNGSLKSFGSEDGILTAFEIAQMDLRKTELVVLSACETALGDVKGTEGVFGLQRAFKLAGVDKMLLSLWKIPDAETADLMNLFYKYYLEGKSARDAFAAAQKEMRKKYAAYYWAAFVLIE